MSTAVYAQKLLFPAKESISSRVDTSSRFVENTRLPVHRWFRYSAGFSANWAESVISEARTAGRVCVLDPFAGSGTTLLAAERLGVKSYGIEAHPFVARVAKAKLQYRTDPESYIKYARLVRKHAGCISGDIDEYPILIRKCFDNDALKCLDRLKRSWQNINDESPQAQLVWLTLISILRTVSHVGTAPWQYVLPNKRKKYPLEPMAAFDAMMQTIYTDMCTLRTVKGPRAVLIEKDARLQTNIKSTAINLVITSPPYANNYDYADATRLEMSFMGEIKKWGDLHDTVRRYLIRSCSQHVPESSENLKELLSVHDILPIRDEISDVCNKLSGVRYKHGGRKTYHLMVACYFIDMAKAWKVLRRYCQDQSLVCFVIGDSAPYGVYVPVIEWMGKLAISAGFHSFEFEKTRDRNVKWKNRKHRVPLCEGRLWVKG